MFREVLSPLTQHRDLTWELAKREFTDRHVGYFLGAFWVVGRPLFLMAMYVFIFAFVLKTKIGGTHDLPLDYTTYILAGLIPWMAFQESMNKSCSAIVDNRSLVQQAMFPLEVLPVKGIMASLLTQLLASCFLVSYVLINHGRLSWTYSLLPLPFAMQFLAMIGVGYTLAAVSVYVRDVKEVIQVVGVAGAYVMPIFYLPQWVPSLFQPLLYLNPFSYMGWCYQDVLYFGRIEHPWAWAGFLLFSLISFYGGYGIFRKLKTSFGSLI